MKLKDDETRIELDFSFSIQDFILGRHVTFWGGIF